MSDAKDTRDFTIVMRGYERQEVDDHLRRTAATVRGLEGRIQQLEQELRAAREAAPSGTAAGSGGQGAGSTTFEALGAETTRILVAAETSAREMREKATRQAELEVAAAERAARERVETASDHAARIIAEAEARKDEVVAEIARLDGVRGGLVNALRDAVGTTTGAVAGLEATPGAAAVHEGAPTGQSDTGGPSATSAPSADPGAAAVEADDSGHTDGAQTDDGDEDDEEGDLPAAVVVVSVDDVGPDEDDRDQHGADSSAATVGTAAPTPEVESEVPEDASPDEAVDTAVAHGTDDRDAHHGGSSGAIHAALSEAAEAAGRPSTSAPSDEVEPGLLRERSLAGVRPGMLRRLRRGLQELQNGVLQRVRERDGDDAESLLPGPDASDGLADVARVFLDAGYRAGRADAVSLAGGTPSQDGPTDARKVASSADRLAANLVAELRTTLLPSLRAGIDADEPDASVSERVGEVFRDLKGPVIEGAVDEHLTRLYGDATVDQWTADGVEAIAWVLGEETRCPEQLCRANAGDGPQGPGQDFPSGHAVPPVHDGCTCALVPG